MKKIASDDLVYLTTRLHARRSRMAEGERLDGLCRLSAIPDLVRARHLDSEVPTATSFQRRLLQDLVEEFSFCLRHVDGAGGELVRWLRSRFQIENIKVLLRGLLASTPPAILQDHLIPLPRELALDAETLLKAKTPDTFAKLLPPGPPRNLLLATTATERDAPGAFLSEAALDSGYYQGLYSRIQPISGHEKEVIGPLVREEVEFFHLQLAVRGKFHHGLPARSLARLAVRGSSAAAERFNAMLAATDIAAAAKFAPGHVFNALPAAHTRDETDGGINPAELEVQAWRHLFRLANGAFRRSHMGLGAVVGYLQLRRMETANLITLSEGIRNGVAAEKIRARLIPWKSPEAVYV